MSGAATSGRPAAGRKWSWDQVRARRLERHGLADPTRDSRPAKVVDAICGAHAQVLTAGELSIGLRIAKSTREDVQHALWTEHSLVKTFGPRGTVHLLPTEELPIWTGALWQLPQASGAMPPDVRLTDEQTDKVVAAIEDALEHAELAMDELSEAVVARTGSWAGDLVMPAFQEMWPRWRQAVGTAARRGALCFGHQRGRKVTYTSPHRWLPGFEPAEGRAAAGELLRRYLRGYGPATPRQFAQWLGAPPRWATELFEELGDQLEPVELDGSRAWLVAGDAAPPSEPPEGLRLLPYFDAYTVGCHPRELLFPGRAAARALNRTGQAGNFPVLLLDGTVAGVWHQRRSGRRLVVTVEPLEPLRGPRRRELDQQVERIGEFLGLQPELTIGAVTAGGHA
jgi:DNA glycosylase AlkZ-like